MNEVLSKPKLVNNFMHKSGYTNVTHKDGVKKVKRGKRDSGNCWDYHTPEKMLRDFLRYLKKEAGPVEVERDIDYIKIASWVCHYRLIDTVDDVPPHLNSKLSPHHAIVIWQLKGIRSSVQVSKAFDISAKAVRDIWHGRSWSGLTGKFEGSR